ncbi:MAG: Gfo/Idh/MocA family oxidoreductase [Fimbriimonadaceae bacterium]|nr:Gfo/Idh/MocA family oxidoreductase [Fimbriimonadaceae bacterium]
MKRLRIGQIGVGHEHASGIALALRNLPDEFELVGVVEEPQPGWYDRAAYEGLPRLSEDELLDVPGLQAVAVETNMPLLVATAQRCADRGLHLHVDKPGGESWAPFERLVATCRQRGLALQMGYMYRTNPALTFCRQALQAGWLGEPFELHVAMSRWDNDAYRRFLADYPGGAMYNFGSHLVDLVVSFLGRPQRVHAFQQQTRGDGLADSGLAVLEYPRATATVRAAITEVDGMKHRRLILCGTRGTVEVCPLERSWDRYASDPLQVRLTLLEAVPGYAAGTHQVDVGVMHGRYEAQLRELAAVIRGERDNPYPYDHELLTHRVLLAAAGYQPWEEQA